MNQSILVLGATGNVGRHLVTLLSEKGCKIKAASRSGDDVAGVEGVVFDYLKPETFEGAFKDVSAVYIVLPGGYAKQDELLIPVVNFAIANGVKVVLQSALGVDADDAIPYRKVELVLERASISYVILRPNWFADNFHTFWKSGIDNKQIALPAAEGATSFIDVRDIAACAAKALTSNEFDNRSLNLTGPAALSYKEAAVALSTALDSEIHYQEIDDATFMNGLVSVGIPQDYASFITAIFEPVRQGWTAVVTDDVSDMLGRPARTLSSYINDNLAKLQS